VEENKITRRVLNYIARGKRKVERRIKNIVFAKDIVTRTE
jgi:hypothetical protein